MEIESTKPSMPDLDFRELAGQFARRWLIVVVLVVTCIISSALYTQFLCTPQYDSTAKIIVFGTTGSHVNQSDIAVSTYLTQDYLELITDRTVLNEVISDLNLNYSYSTLKRRISLRNPDNTRIIEITVRSADPAQSQQIAASICRIAQQKMVDLMGVDRVNIISDAYLPGASSWPNLQRNVLYGGVTGLLISIVLVIILYYVDDKIKNESDVERYLGLSVLGKIPYAKGRTHTTGKYSSQRNKR